MNIQELIEFYGSKAKVARGLKVTPGYVSHWVKAEEIPLGIQYKAEVWTEGKLRADDPDRPDVAHTNYRSSAQNDRSSESSDNLSAFQE